MNIIDGGKAAVYFFIQGGLVPLPSFRCLPPEISATKLKSPIFKKIISVLQAVQIDYFFAFCACWEASQTLNHSLRNGYAQRARRPVDDEKGRTLYGSTPVLFSSKIAP